MQLAESFPVCTNIPLSYLFSSKLNLSYSLKIREVKTTRKIIKLYKPVLIVFTSPGSKQGAFSEVSLPLI
jgi:hypothetical protein